MRWVNCAVSVLHLPVFTKVDGELCHSPHVLSHPHLDSSQLEESGMELAVLRAWVALDVIEDHSRKPAVRGRNGYHQFY